MLPIEELSHDQLIQQIQRFRQRALVALSRYELRNVRIDFLDEGAGSVIFRVKAKAEGSSEMERFVLRIHHLGKRTTSQIEYELLWLAALRRDTHLMVPEPVPARDGSLVQEVTITPDEQGHQCDLLHCSL